MSQIKARVAHAPEDLQSQYFFFDIYGYADPNEIEAERTLAHIRWGYLNANGYVQQYNSAKPPSKHPCRERMIVKIDMFSNNAEKLEALRKAGVF